MKKTTIWLIIAAILIVIGLLGGAIVMASANWNFNLLSTERYQTVTHDVNDDFDNIYVYGDTEKITFLVSDDGKCRVECYENKKLPHSVSIKDGALIVKVSDTRKWYEKITLMSFYSPKITVYLPIAEYSLLKIESDTGDISLPKDLFFKNIEVDVDTGDIDCFSSADEIIMTASTGDIKLGGNTIKSLYITTSTGDITLTSITCQENIALAVNTGDITLTDVICKYLSSSGDTGRITLRRTLASGKFDIERDTGDVIFENSDAAEIYVTTDTGYVKGNLLSDKIFITKTDTGRIRVPSSTTGGRCEITTDTGNIIIDITKQ